MYINVFNLLYFKKIYVYTKSILLYKISYILLQYFTIKFTFSVTTNCTKPLQN